MKALLLLLMISIVVGGCCPPCKPTPMECQALYTPCARPPKPTLAPLDRSKHIGDAANVAVLLRNENAQSAYLDGYNATATCYEQQAGRN